MLYKEERGVEVLAEMNLQKPMTGYIFYLTIILLKRGWNQPPILQIGTQQGSLVLKQDGVTG